MPAQGRVPPVSGDSAPGKLPHFLGLSHGGDVGVLGARPGGRDESAASARTGLLRAGRSRTGPDSSGLATDLPPGSAVLASGTAEGAESRDPARPTLRPSMDCNAARLLEGRRCHPGANQQVRRAAPGPRPKQGRCRGQGPREGKPDQARKEPRLSGRSGRLAASAAPWFLPEVFRVPWRATASSLCSMVSKYLVSSKTTLANYITSNEVVHVMLYHFRRRPRRLPPTCGPAQFP